MNAPFDRANTGKSIDKPDLKKITEMILAGGEIIRSEPARTIVKNILRKIYQESREKNVQMRARHL